MSDGDLERRIELLEDERAIQALVHRYATLCDQRYAPDPLAELFTEDAVWSSASPDGSLDFGTATWSRGDPRALPATDRADHGEKERRAHARRCGERAMVWHRCQRHSGGAVVFGAPRRLARSECGRL